jgi:hypothetical protein
MTISTRTFVCSAALLVLVSHGASAQVPMIMGVFNAGVLAGASVPTGDTGDAFDSGWTAGLWGSYSPLAAKLSIRLQVSHHHLNSVQPQEEDAKLWGYTGDALVHLPAVYVRPYVFAGGGAHTRTGHGSDLSWHAGGGFAFPFLTRTLLFEARYLNVGTGDDRFRTIPVTVGLVF